MASPLAVRLPTAFLQGSADREFSNASLPGCPLLAQSRHGLVHRTCPLSGVKRHDFLRESAFVVAIRSKADMGWCIAHARF
jgi:hypothetical protein